MVEFFNSDVYILFMSKLCTNCHYIGPEKADISGNIVYEFILWILAGISFVLGFILIYPWIFALVFFLLAVRYSINRYKKVKYCPECGHDSMIPVRTPRAQEIIKASNLTVPETMPSQGISGRWLTYLVILGIFAVLAFASLR